MSSELTSNIILLVWRTPLLEPLMFSFRILGGGCFLYLFLFLSLSVSPSLSLCVILHFTFKFTWVLCTVCFTVVGGSESAWTGSVHGRVGVWVGRWAVGRLVGRSVGRPVGESTHLSVGCRPPCVLISRAAGPPVSGWAVGRSGGSVRRPAGSSVGRSIVPRSVARSPGRSPRR